jgi:hypothetical protein
MEKRKENSWPSKNSMRIKREKLLLIRESVKVLVGKSWFVSALLHVLIEHNSKLKTG